MRLPKLDFRKIFVRRDLPGWMDPKLVILLVLVALFMIAMAWTEPGTDARKVSNLANLDIPMLQTPEPVEQDGTPVITPTPLPLDWQTNREMANGLVLGAVILVLIIVGGTFFAIRRKV